jgi:hypothetical protein
MRAYYFRQTSSLRLNIPRLPLTGRSLPYRRPGNLLHAVLLRRCPLKACLVYFSFAVYTFLSLCVFFSLVQPWINGDSVMRIGADSDRYWDVARLLLDPSHSYGASLISFNGNFLGPVILAYVVRYQFLVVVFNYLLFFLALRLASSIPGVSTYLFLGLLMLNLETAISLITLNKEIFGLLSAVLVAKYLLSEERPLFYLGLGLIASLATRWEQAVLVCLVAVFTRKNSFFSRRHKLALVYVIAGITIAYPLFVRFKGQYLMAFIQYDQGANTIVKLNHLQAAYGFPIVLLPKIAMTLLGELIRPTYYLGGQFWEDGFLDFHSQIILPLFSIALVSLLLLALARGKLATKRPIAFMIAIYLIGTALTPFIQPRYEYFVYVLLCLELARTDPEPGPAIATVTLPKLSSRRTAAEDNWSSASANQPDAP